MSGMVFGYLGKPSSTVAISGSYTVPTGYMAVVSGSCKDGGQVTVGGTPIYMSSNPTWSVLGSSPLKYDTAPNNNLFVNSGGAVGTPTPAFASSTAQASSASSGNFTAAEGTVISGSGSWGAVVSLYPTT